ncbi:hypothetical protein AAIR98_000470 [Elusimicrobium simillimum]|uniref:metallophosphoesterase n=1 Tax=Elusimicrobium simillimum TaxID=3143438 RepID=UPI003C6F214A
MKKIIIPVFLLISLNLAAAQIVRGPYVENPTLTSATVKWTTDAPAVSWLEYGPAPKCDQIMAISPEGTDHKIELFGLVANKDFCYKVYAQNNEGAGVQTPVSGTFKTLYSPERKIVKFVIFGNTAGGEVLAPALVEKLQKHNPDFYIHTGDLISTGSASDADKEFFAPYAELFRKAPMFIAVGEKEYGPERDKKEARLFFRQNYTKLHTMTWSKGTPNYYYFDTANARFFFLDTSFANGAVNAPAIDKDSAQYAWLRTSLASTEAGKWKIAVMHAPAYSSGAKGSNLAVRDTFSTLFEYYGVKVVFQGDEFNYERVFPVKNGVEHINGVPYITFGTGAAPELTKREFKEPWTARFLSSQVYGVGEIVDRKLTLTVYNLEDKVIETVEIYL